MLAILSGVLCDGVAYGSLLLLIGVVVIITAALGLPELLIILVLGSTGRLYGGLIGPTAWARLRSSTR